MKRTAIFLCLCFVVTLVSAQKNNVQSAAKAIGLTTFISHDGAQLAGVKENFDELPEAKQFIDLAATNPATANDVKMWYYRGRIYYMIHIANKRDIDPDAISKATESLIKCMETDTKKDFEDSARYFLMTSAILCFQEGVYQHKKGENVKALQLYDLVLKVYPFDKNNDLVRNSVSEKTLYLNSFYSSHELKDKEKTKLYLQKLIDMDYKDPGIYLAMSDILVKEGDTAKALGYIEKGRKDFYDNNELIRKQVWFYSQSGKLEELLKILTADIANDEYNSMLYYVRGSVFDEMKKPVDAEKDYMKCLELDPANFVVNYNLGVMYYNQGAEIFNKAKDILDNNAYTKEKAKAEEKFKKSLPYLEAAYNSNNKDINTVQSLKVLYARLNMNEKFEVMKKRLEELAAKK